MKYKLSEIPALKQKAEAGNVESQCELAEVCYDLVEDAMAFKWASKAAASGHKKAHYLCAYAYLFGTGVEKNIEKACAMFENEISEGNYYGYFGFGLYYEEVIKDYERALAFYQEGAVNGIDGAKARIGWMYEKGIGVDKNLFKAIGIYTELSEKGTYNWANEELYIIYDGQDQEYFEDSRKRDEYLLKAAKGGAAWCELQKAYKCKYNEDTPGYINWLSSAAEHAHPDAMYALGREYLFGENIPQDRQKAGELLENALRYAKKWKLDETVRDCYELLDWAIGVIDSYVSQDLMDELLRKNSASAMLVMAEKYRTGTGVPADKRKMVEYLEKAAAAGSDIAQSELAKIYAYGTDAPKNVSRAVQLAESAVQINPEQENLWILGAVYNELSDTDPVRALRGYEQMYSLVKDAGLLTKLNSEIGFLYIDVYSQYTKGMEYLMKAAGAGHSFSQHLVGLLYYEGKGVKHDIVTAREWWEKAAAQGNEESIRLLNETAHQVPHTRKSGSFFKKLFS